MNTACWGGWARRAVRWGGLVCLAAVMVACGGGSGDAPAPAAPVIGSSGGSVSEASGATVIVPAGALSADTTIRVAMDSTGAPALPQGLVASGNTYVITPHGGDFAEPVEVRVPVPNVTLQPNQELKLAKAQPGGEWEVLNDTVLADGKLKVNVTSFSYFMSVVVTYTLPIAQAAPFAVTTNLTCGEKPCADALGPVTATYTATGDSGQLPVGCPDDSLYVQHGRGSNVSGPGSNFSTTKVQMPRAGGAITQAVTPNVFFAYSFAVGMKCNGWWSTLGWHLDQRVTWARPPAFPQVSILSMPAQLDVVEGLPANLDAIMAGGAYRNAVAAATHVSLGPRTPTPIDRAIIDWERSDNGGSSWRVVSRSYQDEANKLPYGTGPEWSPWSVRHGFIATSMDQGALIRVHACYTPPLEEGAPAPCVTGPATRINMLQQSALPAVTDAPRSVLVRTGQTASLSATAGGAPAPALQWQTRAANTTGAWADVSSGSGATTGNYTTAVLTTADNGTQYRVVATNALGSAESAPVTVSVSDLDVAPTLTTQPAALSVTVGNDAAFAIAARGTEALSYQWQLNGSPITGANSPVLRLSAVTNINAGSYRVVVSNAAGSVTSDAAVLTVSAGTAQVVAPSIVTQPVSVSVGAGNTATFAVGVSGSGPIAYQWLRDGEPISGATAVFYSLAQASGADAAGYAVLVSNSAGSVTSASATLTVGSSSQAVPVTLATQPSPQVQAPGGSATMAVAANGSGPIAYQWLKNGSPVTGATGAVLTLTNLVAEDGASYSVAVTNPLGTVTSDAATLTVLGVPVITSQPAAASAVVGGTATLSVAASGAGLRYQWLRNGVAISGAVAASYTTPALALGDSGAVYSVMVYNGAGIVFSQSAVLTVTAPAPVPASHTLAAGNQHTCALRADGSLACWGYNSSGQIGNGNRTPAMLPTTVSLPEATIAVAAGYDSSCALGSSGTLRCWGDAFASITPVVVGGVNGVDVGGGIKEVTVGRGHACVLTIAGNVWCRGSNSAGQLGNGSTGYSESLVLVQGAGSLPLTNVTGLSAIDFHTCATRTNGSVMCWGQDAQASSLIAIEVGDMTSATQVSGDCAVLGGSATVLCWSGIAAANPLPVAGLANITRIGFGGPNCGIVSGGTVQCWGSGLMGNGQGFQIAVPPVVVFQQAGVGAIATGGGHTCLLRTDAALRCWGSGQFGQLGVGDTAGRTSPTNVPDAVAWAAP